MKFIVLVSSACFLLQACVAIPVKEDSQQTVRLPSSSSTMAIKNKNEDKYSRRLRELNARNPVQEARREKSSGNYFLLAYQSGRGGIRKVPGISVQALQNTSCSFKRLDGFGDTIYGRTHLQYRIAMRNYASQFNREMISSCGSGQTIYLKTQ